MKEELEIYRISPDHVPVELLRVVSEAGLEGYTPREFIEALEADKLLAFVLISGEQKLWVALEYFTAPVNRIHVLYIAGNGFVRNFTAVVTFLRSLAKTCNAEIISARVIDKRMAALMERAGAGLEHIEYRLDLRSKH